MSHTTGSARLPVAGRPQRARTPALVIVAYAVAVYLLLLAVFGCAAGFFAGFGVPEGIDQGTRAAVPAAVAIDLFLLLLFAVQRTVMGRLWFKRRRTPIVPAPAERASFRPGRQPGAGAAVLAVAAAGGAVWKLPGPGAGARRAVYAAGRAIAVGPPSWSAMPAGPGCGRPGCLRGASGTAPRHSPSAACTSASGIP